MFDQFAPTAEDLAGAQYVLAMSEVTYRGRSEQASTSGRLSIPAVVLLLDIDGREDVPYHAMMNEAYLVAAYGELKIGPTSQDHIVGYHFRLDFDGEVEPLAIVGIADGEAIAMFARCEILLISADGHATDDGAPVFAMAPNDPIRWTFYLTPGGPHDHVPTSIKPTPPVAGDPAWNAHRQSWMVKDPDTLMWIEHRSTGWHLLDGLTDAPDPGQWN